MADDTKLTYQQALNRQKFWNGPSTVKKVYRLRDCYEIITNGGDIHYFGLESSKTFSVAEFKDETYESRTKQKNIPSD